MPAPTALLRAPEKLAESEAAMPDAPSDEQSGTLLDPNAITPETQDAPPQAIVEREEDSEVHVDSEGRPNFAPAAAAPAVYRRETRKVPIPPHRMTPLKSSWPKVYEPLVNHLRLQTRMNLKAKAVELRTSKSTGADAGSALQKGEDFVKAFTLGFDVDDAIAILRLDDIYVETFEIKDVKMILHGDHLGRAVGRIAGNGGKTKFAIENASRTRIVLADQKIHIMGGFQNIRIAREAIVSLILGARPSKVYGNLQTVAGRMKERF